MYYTFPHSESVYDRSLRKLRKKVRFNIAIGNFNAQYFITLTYSPEEFEEKGRKVNASKDVSEFLQGIKKHKMPDLQYVWRLEVGTQSTHRIHIHLLTNKCIREFLKVAITDNKGHLIRYEFGNEYESNGWYRGHATNDQVMKGDPSKISNYLSKYLSKSAEEKSESEPYDPIAYGKRRFGTSQGFWNPPKSLWQRLNDTDSGYIEVEVQRIQRTESNSMYFTTKKVTVNMGLAEQSQFTCEQNVLQHKTIMASWKAIFTDENIERYLESEYEPKKAISWLQIDYWFKSHESYLAFLDSKMISRRLKEHLELRKEIAKRQYEALCDITARIRAFEGTYKEKKFQHLRELIKFQISEPIYENYRGILFKKLPVTCVTSNR